MTLSLDDDITLKRGELFDMLEAVEKRGRLEGFTHGLKLYAVMQIYATASGQRREDAGKIITDAMGGLIDAKRKDQTDGSTGSPEGG